MIALAEAGRVSIEWLIGSESASAGRKSVDVALLKQSIEAAEKGLAEMELEGLSAGTKAAIIADIYKKYSEGRRKPGRRKVIKIIKSAA